MSINQLCLIILFFISNLGLSSNLGFNREKPIESIAKLYSKDTEESYYPETIDTIILCYNLGERIPFLEIELSQFR